MDPDKRHASVVPNATFLKPPIDPLLKKILWTLEQQDVPTYGQLLSGGGGGSGGPFEAGRGGPPG